MGTEVKGGKGQQIEYNSAESWDLARKYAGLLGEIPNSFSTLTRSLMADHRQSAAALGSGSSFQLKRLLKSDGLRASIYNAALTFGEELPPFATLEPEKVVEPFKPFDLAVLVSLLYLSRKASRIVK